MFTWTVIYRELTEKVLGYREKQRELVTVLKKIADQGLPMINLKDRDKNGQEFDLQEIDPFTVFAAFNRKGTDDNRKAIIIALQKHLGMAEAAPGDFEGIPIMMPLGSWFFAFSYKRGKEDVALLWDLAHQAVIERLVNKQVFDNCLQIKQVGFAKLTTGLFWLAPDRFLPCDSNTLPYLKEQGISLKTKDYDGYNELMETVRHTLADDFVHISHSAYNDEDVKANTNGQGGVTVPLKNEAAALLAKKGQIILYGPPGTGKTFATRRVAIDLLAENKNGGGSA